MTSILCTLNAKYTLLGDLGSLNLALLRPDLFSTAKLVGDLIFPLPLDAIFKQSLSMNFFST